MLFECVGRNRALAASDPQASQNLVAVERLALAVFLHDRRQRVLDALVGREAAPAAIALASPPSDGAACDESRIDDAAFHLTTIGALHGGFGGAGRSRRIIRRKRTG